MLLSSFQEAAISLSSLSDIARGERPDFYRSHFEHLPAQVSHGKLGSLGEEKASERAFECASVDASFSSFSALDPSGVR